jgi:hypothetical protein
MGVRSGREGTPTPPEENAASMGIPDKQESHGIDGVTQNTSSFPERSTQPIVGSRNIGEDADITATESERIQLC